MIVSFGDKGTEDLYNGNWTNKSRRFPNEIVESALLKLDMLEAAKILEDLVVTRGNHLEKMKGDFKGFMSIRVNKQWRIVFKWIENAAAEVRLTDYHS